MLVDLDALARRIHEAAASKGFWDQERNDGEMLALIHSEISECLEAIRLGNPPDHHCPEFSGAEIEMADCIIRILDMCHSKGWNIGGAIEAKMKFNQSRPHKHGKKF